MMGDSPFQAPALQVLWQAVISDPMNFQSWTALLSQVESVGSPEGAHRAYDEFLRQFPLCFGYWKKYANLAKSHPAPPTAATGGAIQQGISPSFSSVTSAPADQQVDGDGGGIGGNGSGGGGGESAGRGGNCEEGAPGDRRAREVFERAVAATPFCLELWEAFVEEVVGGQGRAGEGGGGVVGDDAGKSEDARRVVERALEAVGDNPGSGPLWRRCVAFEEAQNDQHSSLRVTRLYERAFGYRLKELEALWVGFKDFVDRTPWDKLEPPVVPTASPDEAVLSKILEKKRKAVVAAAAGCKGADAAIAVATSTEDDFSTEAEKKALLIKILEKKRKVSLRAREEREGFERRITRPHFHVKPLDDAQLSAWSQYLDFEQAQSQKASDTAAAAAAAEAAADGVNDRGSSSNVTLASSLRAARKRPRAGEGVDSDGSSGDGSSRGKEEIRRLFERCLVPCASYWWLWERYALWKESVWGLESALEVCERACSPFLRWRPEAAFFRAELLERLGRKDEARGLYERVLTEVAPGLVEGACKLACFERRCGNLDAASAAYRSLLPPPLGSLSVGGAGLGTGRGGGSSSSYWEETTETTRPYLYMQLARFQHRVVGDPGSARATFRAAVSDIPGSRELWLAFLEFEAAQPQALHSGRVEAAFRMAVTESAGDNGAFHDDDDDDDDDARRLTVEDRADLWEWFEEFIEDLSMDVAKVMSVRAEHKAWVRDHGMGAHEAAAAAAAAATAVGITASATSNSGGDLPRDPTSSDRKKLSGISSSHGKTPGGDPTAAVNHTVVPQANPQQRQDAGMAAAVASSGGNIGATYFAGRGSGVGGTGAGAVPAGHGLWVGAGGGGRGADARMPEDQQRKDAWSAYYTQQQQQQPQQQQQQQQQVIQQHMMAASHPPAAVVGTARGAAGGGAAEPVGIGGAVAFTPGPAYLSVGAGLSAPMLQQPQHLQQQQQQQQIDRQVQNQQALHQRLYGASYLPPPH